MTTNKRIAKNTLLLYVRMLLTMAVSLFTVRVVLDQLGTVDYGIYNVIGGIVVMFSFLSGTMASATQRFISFEIGKGEAGSLGIIFKSSFTMYVILMAVIFVVAETLGVWFLNSKMVIPADRLNAANWIYQFSILTFLATIVALPYVSTIIAHEDMSIYAYVSILEVALKLFTAYGLYLVHSDKLIIYGVFWFIATSLTSVTYIIFCMRRYQGCRMGWYWDRQLLMPMISYAGWNMIGALANMCKAQGTNLLLNVFFGPVINASRAIAFQVNSALNNFVTNFYMAARPQITKSYAAGQKQEMFELIYRSAKFSFFLLLLLSMPILIETNFIIELWLKKVPDYVVLFTRILVVNILVEAINNQLVAAVQASGNIKRYQIVVSTLQLLILPISYIFFRYGASPQTTMYISVVLAAISFVPQILIVHQVTGMPIRAYLLQVVYVMLLVASVSFILPCVLSNYMNYGLGRFLTVSVAGLFSCLASIYIFGLRASERSMAVNYLKNKVSKIKS